MVVTSFSQSHILGPVVWHCTSEIVQIMTLNPDVILNKSETALFIKTNQFLLVA